MKLTIAMHLAIPTRMRPSLSPLSSGRNAHAKPSYRIVSYKLSNYARDMETGTGHIP